LINMYGITETTVHVTYRPLEKVDIDSAPGSMIGGPIPDLQVYILDAYLEPTPIGVAGELYVGGAGVARGYLNRPELTAQKFIPDPFSSEASRRLYRSGDLARFLPNGDIEYLGRVDHQVQIRGFRVELGEIESVLGEHPDIKETLVLLREDQPGDPRLVAYYIVPDESAQISINDLRALLKTKLPEYMIPAHFVRLISFPLTSHGKIDRRLLPLPDSARPDLLQEFVAPSSENEMLLADIWRSVLLVDQVGIFDNFFELGGDSILTIQIISRAARAGLKITPRMMFQTTNLKELAEMAEPLGDDNDHEQKAVGSAPLTPIQHWFFEHHRLTPQQFNMSLMLKLEKELEASLLKETINRLLERHDAFRLRFVYQDGDWQQEFIESLEHIPFEVVDFSNIPKRRQKAAIEEKAAQVQESFDLSVPPLIRTIYFKLGNGDSRLLIVLHHLIADGVSWRFIMEDFANIYTQLLQNQLEEGFRSTSYKTWAEKLQTLANSPELESEIPFWLEQAEVEDDEAILPVDFAEGINSYGSVEHVTLSLSHEHTNILLHELPKAFGSQINDILITALLRVISEWTGKRKLRLEMEGHGREDIVADVNLSRTIGWFTSIMHLKLALKSRNIADQIREVSEQLNRVPHHGIGFGVLKYLRHDDRCNALRMSPDPALNFNYLGQFDQFDAQPNLPFEMAAERILNEQAPAENKGALIHVVASVSGRQMHVRWLFSQNVFKAKTINRLAQNYVEELISIIRTQN
ncbi:MAG: non-ribosomal peptide synthetase, partial [Calditrichaeota bacterium]